MAFLIPCLTNRASIFARATKSEIFLKGASGRTGVGRGEAARIESVDGRRGDGRTGEGGGRGKQGDGEGEGGRKVLVIRVLRRSLERR